MPRTSIPITKSTDAGVAQPAQTNGDLTNLMYLPYNDGRVLLEVVSSDAGAQTVTVETPGVVNGLAIADQVVSVAAGATKYLGPFPPAVYNQPDGTVNVNPSVNTTLKFRAYQI